MAKKELEPYQKIERSIITKYRKSLWHPFVMALDEYDLIAPGDRIAVCISGGKDSFLLAKLMQEIQAHGNKPFELQFICMDPGYNAVNRRKIEENAALLHIPRTIFESNVFEIANAAEKNPCYLCAKMRRGWLYKTAKEQGCNKLALGHHRDDVNETTLMSMFYSSEIRTMPPKLHSLHYEGMELIRPLYRIREADILAWVRYNHLEFIRCACRFTEAYEANGNENGMSKRQEIKQLIRELEKTNPNLETSLFNSIHSVCLDTFPGYQTGGEEHSFLERYDDLEGIH